MKTYGAGWSKDSMQELANILGDGGQIFLGNQDDGSWEEVKPEIDKVKVDQEILSLTFDEQGYPLGKVEYSSGDITSDHYWDCECDENHIHYKGDILHCDKCDRHENDMPDSRLIEVQDMLTSTCPQCTESNLTEDKRRCWNCDGGPG
tara:strand:- start:6937 stop:7380 length:444 start_codon:yes stop_codon:yes gene_type:complete